MLDLRHSVLPLACLFPLVACQSGDRQSDVAPIITSGELVEASEPPSEDNSVELDLEQLITSSRIESGVRVVDFELRNRSAEELTFAFMVEWLDRQGQRVSDREARWTHLVLPAEASAPFSITAPSPLAESWRLRATATE